MTAAEIVRRRYELPDPKCRHARLSVRVTSGDPSNREAAYASVLVCDRDTCIEDAKEWAFAYTHIKPTVTRRGTPPDDRPVP